MFFFELDICMFLFASNGWHLPFGGSQFRDRELFAFTSLLDFSTNNSTQSNPAQPHRLCP